MTNREDLEKLFEAALNDKVAPSRFGTPEDQMKTEPRAFRKEVQAASSQPSEAAAQQSVSKAQVTPELEQHPKSDLVDLAKAGGQFADQAVASKNETISAELGELLDQKVAREKRSKHRSRLVTLGILLGIIGGASAWIVTNPERFDAMKKVVAEVKSVGDIKGMVAKYQAALDNVAVRSEQIDAATKSMGVDPASAASKEDQGFDKEMREMMGEDSGPTTAERDKLLREKFEAAKESGSLLNTDSKESD